MENYKTLINQLKQALQPGHSGAKSRPLLSDSFMYIATSLGNHENGVFDSFDRIDTIQITDITFCYTTFSLTDPNLTAISRFRIQL